MILYFNLKKKLLKNDGLQKKGSAQKYTQFTGNKQPCTTKECILVYDKRTNEFTLERLQTNFILKRSRLEGSSKAQIITPRSITPTNENNSKKKKQESTPSTGSVPAVSTTTPTQSQNETKKKLPITQTKSSPPAKSNNNSLPNKAENLFGDDLNLSDDGSDFDDSNL